MFIVSLNYIASLDKVDSFLAEHVEYLNSCYSKGYFIASGRKEPRTGGIIIASCDSLSELKSVLAEDPFNKNLIAEYEIMDFRPSMIAPGYENLSGL